MGILTKNLTCSIAFPSNEIIEELKSHDFEFQTFELITYEKENEGNQNTEFESAQNKCENQVKQSGLFSSWIPELNIISRNEIQTK